MNNLAFVVLNYNSADDTIRCVERLLSFNKNFWIIIVDNFSSDDSQERISKQFKSKKKIILLPSEENRGYAAGNNIGIKYAIGTLNVEYIGIINPDVLIPYNLLEKILTAFSIHKDIVLLSGEMEWNNAKVTNYWDIPTSRNIVTQHSLFFKNKKEVKNTKKISSNVMEVECVSGAFFIAKSFILESINYLDEGTFLYNEENILGINIKKRGFKEAIIKNEFYLHLHPIDKRKKIPLKNKIISSEPSYKSSKYLLEKYYNGKKLRSLFLAEVSNKVFLFLAYLKNLITYEK